MELQFLSFLSDYRDLFGSYEGMEESDISKIEDIFKVKLPQAYKEYIHIFGKKSGNLLGSYLMEAYKLKGNLESAILASIDDLEGVFVDIKPSYFFFGQWQGYIFYFFDCEENKEDPPVYILTDTPKIEKYKNSFSEFIMDEGLKPLLDL